MTADVAPSMWFRPRQTGWGAAVFARVERWLEAERSQLPLWIPVLLGIGIAAWFVLPDARGWGAFLALCGAVALLGLACPPGTRAGRVLLIAGGLLALGTALVWGRAGMLAAPVLARPVVTRFEAMVEAVEPQPARDLIRVRLRPDFRAALPVRVRVNIAEADMPAGLVPGARIRLRARLMPPPEAAVPGAYHFARLAWFQQLGATGRGFAPVELLEPAGRRDAGLRARLTAHLQRSAGEGTGGIAAALVTGDRGAIPEGDAEAMRKAGLAHLLSISGLHVTAVVGATMLAVLRLLSLFPALALRVRLPLVAAGAGAAAAIGYTWLSGAEVPTLRSCIAALLVLAAMALGREAVTLRLVAVGALLVLLVRPEALVGPSFQLSFAAVSVIVALHEHPRLRRLLQKRDEGWPARLGRSLATLLVTGIAVEAALMPIGLFHFHKAGLYGALANIVAIPLTTFVVMPLEALALFLDGFGLGAPAWWAAGRALEALVGLAHLVSDAPGSGAALPAMPTAAFGLMVGGGLWLLLWQTRARRLGLLPFAAGAAWAMATPAPDLIVTGDGRHLAMRTEDGSLAILRERAGDYVRATLGEGAGAEGELPAFDDLPGASCSLDACRVTRQVGERRWSVLATRSGYSLPWQDLVAACKAADIVVSDRRLPDACHPRWLKLDRRTLARTGGVSVALASGRIETVRRAGDDHPWLQAPTVAPPREPRRRFPTRRTDAPTP